MHAITRQAFTQALGQNGGYVEIDRIPEQLRQHLKESGVSDKDLEEVAGGDRVIRGAAEWSNLFSRIGGSEAIFARDSSGRPTPSARAFEALRAHVDENRARAEREGGQRFRGERSLDQVASGRGALTPGDRGEGVRRVQLALADMGFLDPARGVTGSYDAATARAVEQFQREVGLPSSGSVDADTLGALKATAPSPGEVLVRSPEYDRMYSDGRLDVTIALGLDGTSAEAENVRDVLRGLREQGFRAVAATDRERLGLAGDRFDPDARYFTRGFHDPKLDRDVDVVVRLILPGRDDSATARASFERALRQDEVILYAGGAATSEGGRSPAGLRGRLSRTDPGANSGRPDYQLLVLDAPLADELGGRGSRGGLTDTDVIASAANNPAILHGTHLVRFLEGVMRRESNNSMLRDQGNIAQNSLATFGLAGMSSAYTESGFLNNGENRRERRAS